MTTTLGISLAGRRVLIVGGGSVTARRLPRFVDEQAHIVIVAPELSPAVSAIVADRRIEWHEREVRSDDVDGAWIVHTATGDARVDADVAAWCERQRVFCVNASDGAHGSARMTSEVRSGDVVIGVTSGDGVDPRRSARVSASIREVLDSGGVDLRRHRSVPGRVALVGGGPGPVDLMTLRARRLLAEADVVVTDRLGPVAVLDELAPDVEVVHVGKAPGSHPVPQPEINALLVEFARAGKRVVRLKGGDPFVYGRGGEEVAACHAAGVPVEVVPAPSSAMAVPQAAGIPVTHRGVASSMHIINGQSGLSMADIAAMRDDSVTTVLLMGVAAFASMSRQAIRMGAPAGRPVAVVENGHSECQRTIRSTLGDAARELVEAQVRNPSVIVIGEVAKAGLLLPETGATAPVSAGSA